MSFDLKKFKQAFCRAVWGDLTTARLDILQHQAAERGRAYKYLEEREQMARHMLLATPEDAPEYFLREDWWKRCKADLEDFGRGEREVVEAKTKTH